MTTKELLSILVTYGAEVEGEPISESNAFMTYIEAFSGSASYPKLTEFLETLIVSGYSVANGLDETFFLSRSRHKSVLPVWQELADEIASSSTQSADAQSLFNRICRIIMARFIDKWEHICAVMLADYNPIHNYDMTETGENTGSKNTTQSTKDTGSEKESTNTDLTTTTNPNLTTNETSKTSDSVKTETTTSGTSGLYGFDSSTSVPSDTDSGTRTVSGTPADNYSETSDTVTESGTTSVHSQGAEASNYTSVSRTGETSADGTETVTGNHSLKRSGNIGVTTTQKMVTEELRLRMTTISDIILADMDSVVCNMTYEVHR